MKDWKWYGNAGHFCGSSECHFHMCTEVGGYLVSTVGEYQPYPKQPKQTIGAGSKDFYETYVFKRTDERCACGCGLPEISLAEIEGIRWETPKDANEGHLAMCKKYSELS